MRPDDIKTLVDIVSGIVTTMTLLAAGWWFFINRSLAGTAQITLTLKEVTIVNSTRIAIIGVRIKNLGRTRIIKGHCTAVAKVVKVRSYSEPVRIFAEASLDYSEGQEIFESLKEIEPNEETSCDVAFALNKPTLLMVGVKLKRKWTKEAWQASAVFNADDKTKVPSSVDFP